jgi:multiple sugar transport system substrate-binding protein
MLKSRFAWLAVLAMVIMPLLAACGTESPAATAVPPAATDTAVPAAAAPTDTPAAAAATNTTAPAAMVSPTVQPTVLAGGEGCAAGAPKVTWYIGLGTGADADQIPKEKAWVDSFNKSQTDACVVMQVVHNPESYDTLKAQLAAGTGPDIVGPVGKAGRASFQGAWQDIAPLAQKAGFDLTKYDPALLDFTKDEGVLVGIPFALFPSFIYYNKTLFDEAKLPYPPHKVGEQYQGKDWNLETFQALAQKLTVDASGNDATASSFDAKNIKQFGFYDGPTDARGVAVLFGGGVPYDPASPTTAKIPDNWRTAWKWYYDSVWKLHIAPNDDYQKSDLLKKGAPWPSGNVAMSHSHTWWTCCFDLQKMNWDIAVMPTVNGKITAKLHGDTFAILKSSKNQDAAFKVLSKMIVAKDLFQIYGGMPATVTDRPDFFKAFDVRTAPNKIDWSVAEEMLKYPDIPNHEAWLPNLIKANDLFAKFRTLLDQTPNLNVDQEIDKLQTQLDALFKAAPTPTK